MRYARWAGSRDRLNEALAKLARGWKQNDSRAYFRARREILDTLPECVR